MERTSSSNRKAPWQGGSFWFGYPPVLLRDIELQAALSAFVDLAGGWVTCPPVRRKAYNSQDVCRVHVTLEIL